MHASNAAYRCDSIVQDKVHRQLQQVLDRCCCCGITVTPGVAMTCGGERVRAERRRRSGQEDAQRHRGVLRQRRQAGVERGLQGAPPVTAQRDVRAGRSANGIGQVAGKAWAIYATRRPVVLIR